MAIAHILFNDSTKHGAQLRSGLNNLERGLEQLNDVLAAMQLMRDGSSITQYLVDKYGFPDVATAQAAFDELSSVLFKLNTNESVDSVNAAMLQVFNKLR